MHRKSKLCLVTFFVLLAGFSVVFADYGGWNEGGEVICNADSTQGSHEIAADGAGGAILAWCDVRTNPDIYAQRINASGDVEWTANGIVIASGSDWQFNPGIATDNAGGAYVTWKQNWLPEPNYIGFYIIKRVNASGSAVGARTVHVTDYSYGFQNVCSDGKTGAVVAWSEPGDGDDLDLFAVGVDSNVSVSWSTITVCGEDGNQIEHRAIPDGAGGVIFVWKDNRDDNYDIYAQRVDSTGARLWDTTGVAVCTATGLQEGICLATDGDEGVIIAWMDRYAGGDPGIYAQRIDEDGDERWTSGGVLICDETDYGSSPCITSDTWGGAIIAWHDSRSGAAGIYAQRVNSTGYTQWTSNGIPVCTYASNQAYINAATDGERGAIIVWGDDRNSDYDLFAQRVDEYGDTKWQTDGIPICTESNNQFAPCLVSDGDDGVIIAWNDKRDDENGDIYAQKIDSYFDFPAPGCEVTYLFTRYSSGDTVTARDFMNGCPQGDFNILEAIVDFDENDVPRDIEKDELKLVKPDTLITFWSDGDITADSAATYGDSIYATFTHAYISHNYASDYLTILGIDVAVTFDDATIGYIDSLIAKSPDYTGDGDVDISDLGFFSGTYNKCDQSNGYNPWFDFNDDDCVDLSDYGFFGEHYQHGKPAGYQGMWLASRISLSDVELALSAGNPVETRGARVLPVTVYIDNCAAVTTLCAGLEIDQSVLEYARWIPHPDFPAVSAAAPASSHGRDILFISAFDLAADGNGRIEMGTIEFIVTGRNEHTDGASGFALVFGDILTADGKVKSIRGIECSDGDRVPELRTTLSNNYPNPFNPATTIEYSISGDMHVNLSIYNVNGQLVRTLVDGFKRRDYYHIIWNGKDHRGVPTASGIYFYRLKTDDVTISKKLLLLR